MPVISMLPKFVLDFTCVASFRNRSASNVTRVESRGQTSDFLPSPIELRKGWAKFLNSEWTLTSLTKVPTSYFRRDAAARVGRLNMFKM